MAVLSIAIILLGLILIYIFLIRPWQLHWGATKKEIKLNLPGDQIVTKTNFNATRAITVNAAPNHIWRWIIQIGSGRAGWYSIDWIDSGQGVSCNYR